jgi:hypothetical protein
MTFGDTTLSREIGPYSAEVPWRAVVHFGTEAWVLSPPLTIHLVAFVLLLHLIIG